MSTDKTFFDDALTPRKHLLFVSEASAWHTLKPHWDTFNMLTVQRIRFEAWELSLAFLNVQVWALFLRTWSILHFKVLPRLK